MGLSILSNPKIYYKAFYQEAFTGEDATWSSVLYVELIMPNGSALGQSKLMLDASGASGTMVIPEGLTSGTYYLKAFLDSEYEVIERTESNNYATTTVIVDNSNLI